MSYSYTTICWGDMFFYHLTRPHPKVSLDPGASAVSPCIRQCDITWVGVKKTFFQARQRVPVNCNMLGTCCVSDALQLFLSEQTTAPGSKGGTLLGAQIRAMRHLSCVSPAFPPGLRMSHTVRWSKILGFINTWTFKSTVCFYICLYLDICSAGSETTKTPF